MKINIKKLREDAIIPTKGTTKSAGLDLYALLEDSKKVIPSGKTVKINTGLAVEIPDGYFAGIFARSGIATKRGLRPANCVGVIDSDYRGEIIIAIHNDSDIDEEILNKERVAQMVIMPYLDVEFNEVDDLSSSDRDHGGFGSTGTK
ncbi:MAG: dUTP diphosphatase [Bacilli bacterium]|nr:dUTP diphosphatase [Bacilli bacterium]